MHILVLLLLALLLSFSPAAAAPVRMTNTMCPVIDGDEAKPEFHVEYEGRVIYFSSEAAIELFNASPEEYLPNLPDPANVPKWIDSKVTREVAAQPPNEPVSVARLVSFFGRYHPAMVHFPVALIVVALLAELLSFKWPSLRDAAIFCLAIAAMGGVAAVASGWVLAGSREMNGPLVDVQELHRWLGVATLASCVVALALGLSARRWPKSPARAFYLAVLVGSAALVTLAGHFGATLVYGFEGLKF